MSNPLLAMLNKFGVHEDHFGDSTANCRYLQAKLRSFQTGSPQHVSKPRELRLQASPFHFVAIIDYGQQARGFGVGGLGARPRLRTGQLEAEFQTPVDIFGQFAVGPGVQLFEF
jgi:hypothetical protein